MLHRLKQHGLRQIYVDGYMQPALYEHEVARILEKNLNRCNAFIYNQGLGTAVLLSLPSSFVLRVHTPNDALIIELDVPIVGNPTYSDVLHDACHAAYHDLDPRAMHLEFQLDGRHVNLALDAYQEIYSSGRTTVFLVPNKF